jgi:thymidylate synthase
VPYNIAGYALLLELFSHFTRIRAGIFAHTLIDAHIYTSKPDGSMSEYDHVRGLKKQLTRDPRPLPRLSIDRSLGSLEEIAKLLEADTEIVMRHFVLDGYHPHPPIPFKVAV